MEEKGRVITISTGSWVRLVVVILLGYAALQVGNFLLVLIASIVIASAIEPIALWAGRRNIPRVPIVVSVYVLGALLFSGIFYFLLLPLIGEISSFIKTFTVYSNAVVSGNVLSDMFESQKVFGGINAPELVGQIGAYLNEWSDFLSQGIFSSLSAVSGGVMGFMLMIVLSFYLAVQDDGVSKFLQIIVPEKYESYTIGLWKRSHTKIGRWMQGQLFLGVLVMILVYIGLIIIGVPHAFLLAVIAGILELIPVFGPIIAAIPAVFVAYASADITIALVVAALYLAIQQLENHVFYPLVVKKVIGMPPIVSIIALVIGGELVGFLGIIVAVPVAAVVMELISDLEERKLAKHLAREAKN